jgi:hypothetical protein
MRREMIPGSSVIAPGLVLLQPAIELDDHLGLGRRVVPSQQSEWCCEAREDLVGTIPQGRHRLGGVARTHRVANHEPFDVIPCDASRSDWSAQYHPALDDLDSGCGDTEDRGERGDSRYQTPNLHLSLRSSARSRRGRQQEHADSSSALQGGPRAVGKHE